MNQRNWRKAIGALKDSTKVGLAKVNSDYKELDIAIAKATTHAETLPNEKYIGTIFEAISSLKPRADVAHCINALVGRLVKTHNWAVSFKTLIIIHRALREVDATFREELITRAKDLILNLSDFKDDSSSKALDYSAWVCTYALYIGERLECIDVMQYDIWTESAKTSELDSTDLLSHLPALQLLLLRVLNCRPEGAAVYNKMIQYALSIVVSESFKIYDAINGCIQNLVDKFFDMRRHEALRAVEIYRKAGHQALRLSAFYDLCKCFDLGHGIKYVKIEQPPTSFLGAMEEFIKETSQYQTVDAVKSPPSPTLAIEDKKVISEYEKAEIEPIDSLQSSEAIATKALVPVHAPFPDLLSFDDSSQNVVALEDNNALALALAIVSNGDSLDNKNNSDLINGSVGWELALVGAPSSNESAIADSKLCCKVQSFDDFSQNVAALEDNNALALAIVSNGNSLDDKNNSDLINGSVGWELALVGAPSSNESAAADRKLAGGLDKLTLYSLYDDAISKRWNYHLGKVVPNPFEASRFHQDPFHASNCIAPPTNVQMAAMAQQLQSMSTNPFGNPFRPTDAYPYPSHNNNNNVSYSGLL